jgi:1-hydroxycarotenoid 3,4-desaturase
VLVIGSGAAGLSAAICLASQGCQVTVLEKEAAAGGKMRRVALAPVGDAPSAGLSAVSAQATPALDAGPTVFTMRWVLQELMHEAGLRCEDYVRMQPLSVLARHAWGPDAQQDRLDLFADASASTDAIGRFAGAADARAFQTFCAQARQTLRVLEPIYIRSPRPGFAAMVAALGPRGLAQLASLGPLASLATHLGKRFRDPRLVQLFARYATYCGASPWLAPATLLLIAQVEMDGVFSIEGGMHGLAQGLARAAQQCGATLRYGTAVHRLETERGRLSAVRLGDGERLSADAVVFNGDSQALATGLLGDGVRGALPRLPRERRSLSALTWLMHARSEGFPLVRHNVFFDADYESEFDDIFRLRRLPRRATVYVCAQDRADDAGLPQPGAPERLMCLVNAPADGETTLPEEELEACEQRTRHLLAHHGLSLQPQSAQWVGPAQFARLFPASGGALYGPASHGWMAQFRRSPSHSRIPGLYLAGGTVHPGPGVPMAMMSGRLAAAALMADLASTRRLHPAATSGGTSTASATTVGTRSR